MPVTLPDLFARRGPEPFRGAQCWEAQVVSVTGKGVYVTLPRYDRTLRWGPLMPSDFTAKVGDKLAVTLSDAGLPWAVSGKGGDGGGDTDGNVDGGEPDSVYGGTPLIDGNGVTP